MLKVFVSQTLISTCVLALLALVLTYFLFGRTLISYARVEKRAGKKAVNYGGAIAGYLLVLQALMTGYGRLVDKEDTKGPSTLIDLDGSWQMRLVSSTGDTIVRNGSASIRQKPGSLQLSVVGRVADLNDPDAPVAFSSRIGGLSDNFMYFVYENGNQEMGVARGIILETRPDSFFLDYSDLHGSDRNNDPAGRLYFVRRAAPDNKVELAGVFSP